MGNLIEIIILVIIAIQFTQGKVINHKNKIRDNKIWRDTTNPSTNDVTNNCHVTEDETIMEKIYHINTCRGSLDSQFTEFDIKKTPDDVRKRRASVFDEKFEWQKHEDGMVYIPYLIETDLSQEVRGMVMLAMQDFNIRTCIRFLPRTNQEDFVYIFSSGQGCWSYIGKQGGRNDVSLDPQCNKKGIVIHELMHVLGFKHEHSRTDRDRHITIHWQNILPVHVGQFTKDLYGETVIHGTEYDDQSVMHYGNYLGGNGGVTITSKNDPNKKLGQRVGFSMLDLREINLKYKCGKNYVAYD